MQHDPTLFMRADQVEAAWRLLMPVLDVWGNSNPPNFPNYPAGSWGPTAADKLLAREGHAWRPIA
jgi:glucose-6-phosphate 1-dehydrogenase